MTLQEKHKSKKKQPKTEDDIRVIRLALHKSSFFTCLDEEQVDRFINSAELRSYTPGEMIVLQGSMMDDEDSEMFMHDKKELGETTAQLLKRITVDAQDFNDIVDELSEEVDVGENEDASDLKSKHDEPLSSHDDDMDENYMKDDTHLMDEKAQLSKNPSIQKLKEENLAIYVVRSGTANVWLDNNLVSSVGPGTLFGEGAIVFNRAHSASVTAGERSQSDGIHSSKNDDQEKNNLECWVVPAKTFRRYVLKSENMVQMFDTLAKNSKLGKAPNKNDNVDDDEEENEAFMTMDDFVKSCTDPEITSALNTSTAVENENENENENELLEEVPLTSDALRVANTFNILRKSKGYQRINLEDFCLFHAIMARPDPEVDIAFLLMDRQKRGYISLYDFKVCAP